MAREPNWIDGLRGIASFIVVCGHLCTAFVPWLHSPAAAPNTAPKIFQLPFLRLAVGGRSAVALFFLITGYVNSIGPIGKSRSGNPQAAFMGIARSALARSGRLVLPTMVATFISWLLACMNAYHMTKHVDSTWIRQGWHGPEASLWASLRSLGRAQVETWTIGWDEYDGTQWTLHLFLEGSMLVYMTMLATILVRPRARLAIYAALYLYFWRQAQVWLVRKQDDGDGISIGAIKGLNIIIGMLIAELHSHLKDTATSILPAPLPLLTIILGMFLSGYPQDNAPNMPWSAHMQTWMTALTVKDADVRRYWDHLGASLILLGIFFSRNARRLLSTPFFNFLGRVSFPVYLIHNTLIKTVLTWMVYAPSALHPVRDGKGGFRDLQRGNAFHVVVAVVVYFYILYRAAALWVRFVDPACVWVVNGATRWAYGTGEPAPGGQGVPLLRGAETSAILPL